MFMLFPKNHSILVMVLLSLVSISSSQFRAFSRFSSDRGSFPFSKSRQNSPFQTSPVIKTLTTSKPKFNLFARLQVVTTADPLPSITSSSTTSSSASTTALFTTISTTSAFPNSSTTSRTAAQQSNISRNNLRKLSRFQPTKSVTVSSTPPPVTSTRRGLPSLSSSLFTRPKSGSSSNKPASLVGKVSSAESRKQVSTTVLPTATTTTLTTNSTASPPSSVTRSRKKNIFFGNKQSTSTQPTITVIQSTEQPSLILSRLSLPTRRILLRSGQVGQGKVEVQREQVKGDSLLEDEAGDKSSETGGVGQDVDSQRKVQKTGTINSLLPVGMKTLSDNFKGLVKRLNLPGRRNKSVISATATTTKSTSILEIAVDNVDDLTHETEYTKKIMEDVLQSIEEAVSNEDLSSSIPVPSQATTSSFKKPSNVRPTFFNRSALKDKLRPLIAAALSSPNSSTISLDTKVDLLRKVLTEQTPPHIRSHLMSNKFTEHARKLFLQNKSFSATNTVSISSTSTVPVISTSNPTTTNSIEPTTTILAKSNYFSSLKASIMTSADSSLGKVSLSSTESPVISTNSPFSLSVSSDISTVPALTSTVSKSSLSLKRKVQSLPEVPNRNVLLSALTFIKSKSVTQTPSINNELTTTSIINSADALPKPVKSILLRKVSLSPTELPVVSTSSDSSASSTVPDLTSTVSKSSPTLKRKVQSLPEASIMNSADSSLSKPVKSILLRKFSLFPTELPVVSTASPVSSPDYSASSTVPALTSAVSKSSTALKRKVQYLPEVPKRNVLHSAFASKSKSVTQTPGSETEGAILSSSTATGIHLPMNIKAVTQASSTSPIITQQPIKSKSATLFPIRINISKSATFSPIRITKPTSPIRVTKIAFSVTTTSASSSRITPSQMDSKMMAARLVNFFQPQSKHLGSSESFKPDSTTLPTGSTPTTRRVQNIPLRQEQSPSSSIFHLHAPSTTLVTARMRGPTKLLIPKLSITNTELLLSTTLSLVLSTPSPIHTTQPVATNPSKRPVQVFIPSHQPTLSTVKSSRPFLATPAVLIPQEPALPSSSSSNLGPSILVVPPVLILDGSALDSAVTLQEEFSQTEVPITEQPRMRKIFFGQGSSSALLASFRPDRDGNIHLVTRDGLTLASAGRGSTIPVREELPAGLARTFRITPVIISGLRGAGEEGLSLGNMVKRNGRKFF